MSFINKPVLNPIQIKNHKIILLIISLFFVSLVTLLYLSVRKPFVAKYDSKRFVVNTYGYVLAALLIVSMLIITMDLNSYDINNTKLLAAFVLGILCILTIHNTNSNIIKHMLWVSFAILMAIIMYPVYKKTIDDKTLPNILVTLFVITFLLSVFVFFSKREQFASYGGYLMYALVSLIVFQLLDMLFFDPSRKKLKIYGIITVILFSGFLLYDTDVLLTKSKIINNPDYPVESMNLILDIANLFSGLATSSDK